MLEVLPVKLLSDEDSLIFGNLNVALGKLARSGLPVAAGVAVTPPELHLKPVLEHFDFGHKEIFEQSLNLVKREINSTPVPEILAKEAGKHKQFFLSGKIIKSVKDLWLDLLGIWLDQVKQRLWKDGFYQGITEDLDPQVVIFVKKPEAYGSAYFDSLQDDSVISVKHGKLRPDDLKKLDEIVMEANKKLFIPHEFEWVVDGGVKLVKVLQYTPPVILNAVKDPSRMRDSNELRDSSLITQNDRKKSAVKVFSGQPMEDCDGIYIASEKILDLNKPKESFEDLLWKLVESAITFPDLPILLKLADKSEGMGKVRGALRLLHQKSLLDPLLDALDFVRHKKNLNNVHIVVPFVRSVEELIQIKRELAVKKLMRKNSLQIWMEVATPENIINLEEYLLAGVDGVVLNMDELISHFSGFDYQEAQLMFYKRQVSGFLKFLEDGLKLLHKSKKPFLAFGSIVLDPQVLEFLVEKGVYGVVVERFEAPFARDLLHQTEKQNILSLGTN